jgi:hypothetical protein
MHSTPPSSPARASAKPKVSLLTGLLTGFLLLLVPLTATALDLEPGDILVTNNSTPGPPGPFVGEKLAMYSHMPSYRKMLDIEGSESPDDLALIGDEKVLDAGLDRLRALGVSDFEASIVSLEDGAEERTLQYLESRLKAD